MSKNKLNIAVVAASLGTSLAVAGPVPSAKEMQMQKIIEDNGIFVETSQKGITLSGYVDVSYNYNFNGGTTDGSSDLRHLFNQLGGEPSPSVGGRQFDVDSNDFSVNQVKLAFEKALPEENTWAAGFRIDLLFGEDTKYIAGNDGQASLQQAYVNFRIPVGNGLDVKFGKFVTLLGYEVIETPSNINVTRSINFTYAIPLHHTGILFTYPLNDLVELSLGLVNGWNNEDSDFLDGSDFSKAITGQIKVKNPGGNAVTALSFIYSPEGESAINNAVTRRALVGGLPSPGVEFNENSNTFVVNWWGEWLPKFANDRLLLAFELNYGFVEDNYGYTFQGRNAIKGFGENFDMWYGAALYAKYQVNDVLSLASRFEYFKDLDGSARLADAYTPLSVDFRKYGVNREGAMFHTNVDIYSWTLTAGFDVWENMLLRLEYRVDLLSSDGGHDLSSGWDADHLFGSDSSIQHSIILNASYSF
jgi:hypothetical protein